MEGQAVTDDEKKLKEALSMPVRAYLLGITHLLLGIRFVLLLIFIAVCLLGIIQAAKAEGIGLTVGAGARSKVSDIKLARFYYQQPVDAIPWLMKRDELGYLHMPADRSAFFYFRSYGKSFGDMSSKLWVDLYAGAGAISSPGNRLGSTFQFTQDVAIGSGPLGVGYKHISNAGLKRPNQGVDMLHFTLRLEW